MSKQLSKAKEDIMKLVKTKKLCIQRRRKEQPQKVLLLSALIASSFLIAGQAQAASSADCKITHSDHSIHFTTPAGNPSFSYFHDRTNLISGSIMMSGLGESLRRCYYDSSPDPQVTPSADCDISATERNNTTNYMTVLNTDDNTYCLYVYKVKLSLDPPVVNPTSVPIFTPLGLLAMVSGLLWFGKRRRKLEI